MVNQTDINKIIIRKGLTKELYSELLDSGQIGQNDLCFIEDDFDTEPTPGSDGLITSGGVYSALSTKQNTLVSGKNIKTINGNSVLGSGNIVIQGGGESTYKGDWNSDTQYHKGDIVSWWTTFYIAIQDNIDIDPGHFFYWSMISNEKIVDYSQVSDDKEYPIGLTGYDASGSGYAGPVKFTRSQQVTVNASTGVLTAAGGMVAKTEASSDNSTKVATTAFVKTAGASKQDTLVSGENIKTINGESVLGSGNIVIESAPEIDNTTITVNGNGQLQSSGMVNENQVSTLDNVHTWTGTQSQWDHFSSWIYRNWTHEGEEIRTENNLPSGVDWYLLAYGGKFVAFSGATYSKSNKAAYSTDGLNWVEVTLPIQCYWSSLIYANNKFVAISSDDDKVIYSTDGINWSESTLPYSSGWRSMTYGSGKIVAIAGGTNAVYSTDAINWISITLPSFSNWSSVCYGGGKFVAVSQGTSFLYSTNGIEWNTGSLPLESTLKRISYGNGRFVVIGDRLNTSLYSTDGINWTESTTPPASADWKDLTYADGRFVAVSSSRTYDVYSTNGEEWIDILNPLTKTYARWAVAYGNNTLVRLSNNKSIAVSKLVSNVYTLQENPQIGDMVYSAPLVGSPLSITAVGEGTITLSDNNAYNRNSSGDTRTQSIGEEHPDYISYITDTHKLMLGETEIANKTTLDNVPTQGSTNGITSGAVYSVLGDLETALHNLNSGTSESE